MPKCPRCGNELRYIPQQNNWWCDSCKYYPYATYTNQQTTSKPLITSWSETGVGDWVVAFGLLLFMAGILFFVAGNILLLLISISVIIAGSMIMAYEKSQKNASSGHPANTIIYTNPTYMTPTTAQGGSSSVRDKLLELKKLQENNLITPEEYELQRKKILDEL